MEKIYPNVADLGFPIVISICLLVSIERKLKELTHIITELSRVIAKINPTVNLNQSPNLLLIQL